MSRTWVNGSPPFLNADNLNALETDVTTALGVPDAALAARVVTGATATALNATYAPKAKSPFLTDASFTPAKFYNPASGIYNLTGANWKHARMAIANARAGAGLCRVAVIGDSITAGWGATPTSSVSALAWPQIMREALGSVNGIPVAGTGDVMAGPRGVYGAVYQDNRWANGGWANVSVSDNSSGFGITSVASSNTATFTSDKAGTVAEFTYARRTGWGTFTVTVKNSSGTTLTGPTSYNSSNATPDMQRVTLTGLTLDVGSTIVFTSTSSGVNAIMSAGVRNTTGLLVTNLGAGSASTSTWNNFTAPSGGGSQQNGWVAQYILAAGVDILLIALGTNDGQNSNTSQTPAQYATNMASIVSTLKTSTTDVALVHPIPGNPGTAPNLWTAAAPNGISSTTFYKASESLGVPLVDLSDRWQDYATANTAGMMYDTLHPSNAGHQRIGLDVANLLTA